MRKNITLSADDALIKKARKRARSEHTSLNRVFREWLQGYAVRDSADGAFDRLMDCMDHVESGRSFSRDEMNDR